MNGYDFPMAMLWRSNRILNYWALAWPCKLLGGALASRRRHQSRLGHVSFLAIRHFQDSKIQKSFCWKASIPYYQHAISSFLEDADPICKLHKKNDRRIFPTLKQPSMFKILSTGPPIQATGPSIRMQGWESV